MTKSIFGYNAFNSVLFLALSLLVLYMLLNGYQLLFVSLMDISSFMMLAYLESRLERKRHREALISNLLSSLQHIRTLLIRSKMPISSALERTAAVSQNKELSVSLLEVKNRLRIGQDFSQAVKSAKTSAPLMWEGLQQIASAYSSNFDMVTAIRDAYSAMFHEYLEKIERFYSSVQKYTSLGMVIGTIAPSFALFAMVGYSIINTSSGAFLPALLFVVVLPSVFSALRLLYVEPYAA